MRRTISVFCVLASLVVSLAACSKTETEKQTPATICEAAKAKSLVDECKINKANANDRDFVLKVGGELAAAITVQQLESEDAMEKAFVANQKEVAALGSDKDNFTQLRKDKKRKLVITGGSLSHAAEVKPKFDQLIAFIQPDS